MKKNSFVAHGINSKCFCLDVNAPLRSNRRCVSHAMYCVSNNARHIIRHDTSLTGWSGSNRDNGSNMGEHVHARAEYTLASFMQAPKLRYNLWTTFSRVELWSRCNYYAPFDLWQLYDAKTASFRSIHNAMSENERANESPETKFARSLRLLAMVNKPISHVSFVFS